jgi:tripartite-type tricarboxylate transporter receptor subunit TctC
MATRRRVLIMGSAALTSGFGIAQERDWPTRPVRMIVPLPPGGAYDYLARAVSDPLSQRLGQTVVVENRAGADGRIGVGYVARQPADGYTIGIISVTNVIHPSLFKDVPYEILKDFAPLGMIAHAPFVLVVGPGLGNVRTPAEYVQLARQQPGKMTFGSSGIGSPFHLGGEQLKSALGLDMLHVAYKGAVPLLNALLAGEVDSAIGPLGPYMSHINAGKLRALATMTDKRVAALPQTPTLNEALGQSKLAMVSWLGFVAPAGTPPVVVARLNKELAAVVSQPSFEREKLVSQSYEPMNTDPSYMAAVMKADFATYARIVRDARIPAQ